MAYSDFVTSLSTMMGEQDPTNSDFQNILPSIIAYGEGRMYRDLDMLGTRFSDTSQSTVANNRALTLPSQTLILDNLNIIDLLGNRNQLIPVTREFLDFAWPNATGATVPVYYAPTNQLAVLLGPWPDQVYTAEVVGIQTPAPLSVSNTTTLLTTYLQETFLTCCMIYASAYQKNFGAQSDDPQAAQSWEQQYTALMKSAAIYELRKKAQSEDWSSNSPNPIAGASMPRR